MHHLPTNLTKAFKSAVLGALFIAQVTGCGTGSDQTHGATKPIFIGKWKVKSIKPARYEDLEPDQKKFYDDEMKRMLDSSYFVFNPDSTYATQTGPDAEKGKWISDKAHTRLVLLSNDSVATRYFIEGMIEGGLLRIKNVDTKDSVIIDLIKSN
jgi:hypothetical protein